MDADNGRVPNVTPPYHHGTVIGQPKINKTSNRLQMKQERPQNKS